MIFPMTQFVCSRSFKALKFVCYSIIILFFTEKSNSFVIAFESTSRKVCRADKSCPVALRESKLINLRMQFSSNHYLSTLSGNQFSLV